jgi:hypothetical protein
MQSPLDLENLQRKKWMRWKKIIEDLLNFFPEWKLEIAKLDPYVRNQLRINPNPQIQQRKPKNEEQKIQAPFKNENFI